MSGPESLLRVADVELGFGDVTVLGGVDLEVREGESWFLIGPNGSGKTTLLRAMLGMLAPWSGRIERATPAARTGYVPQRTQFGGALPTTVQEFVSLGFVASDVPRSERPGVVRACLDRVALRGLERTAWGALSGGQRQRALLARALVRRPSLLALDEPTEGLDVTTQDSLLEALASLRQESTLTLLVVTHRLDIAERFASHVALFQAGRVHAGPRDEMLEHERLGRAFARVELAT